MAIARGDGPKAAVDIPEREVVVAILAHRGQPTEAPPIARARDHAEMTFGFGQAPRRRAPAVRRSLPGQATQVLDKSSLLPVVT